MRAIMGRDTSPELRVRKALWTLGLRGYRVHMARLPGRPDIVYSRLKVAVFIDGCFWHGCPRCYRQPKSNEAYWRSKIGKNAARDAKNRRRLRALGWHVIRIWEHDTTPARLAGAARRIARMLNKAKGGSG